MPATRSRTENWRSSLTSLYERGGALEITLPRYANCTPEHAPLPSDTEAATHLIWRVRILGLSSSEIVVEPPATLGHVIPIMPGSTLVGVIVIGQNRWMFQTTCLGITNTTGPSGRAMPALRLRMPTDVERCQRRNFYRVSAIGLNLPHVECYPLLDPHTAAIAEAAARVEIKDLTSGDISSSASAHNAKPVLPDVGPRFGATLMNVGGGGVGLLIETDDRMRLDSGRFYWLRLDLSPWLPAPLPVTARLKHTHIDSTQRLYAGMAFEFGFNADHEPFVVEQLSRAVAEMQRRQRDDRAAA